MTSETPNRGENPVADPFDPAQLRLSQDFAAATGIKKILSTVPVRKPDRQWFVRTHPDDDFQLSTAVLELKEDRETYLVDRSLWNELPGEIIPKILFTAVNRQGVVFLWPIRLPGEDSRIDEWNRTALEGARKARVKWVRIVANMSLGANEIFEATGELPEPEWPDEDFRELLEIAFRNRYIESLDHSVIRRLRGEV